MSVEFGWTDSKDLMISIIASGVAAILYLMYSAASGFIPFAFFFYAFGVFTIGMVFSAIKPEPVSWMWALVSGIFTGILLIVQSVAVSSGSITPQEFLILLSNLPISISLYFAGYGVVALIDVTMDELL